MTPGKWYDFDELMHWILKDMGVVKDFQKWIFWSNNPLGNALTDFVCTLAELKILERNDEGQFRLPEGFNAAEPLHVPVSADTQRRQGPDELATLRDAGGG
jgi:hypothetical protein